jgi:hypothetical protein
MFWAGPMRIQPQSVAPRGRRLIGKPAHVARQHAIRRGSGRAIPSSEEIAAAAVLGVTLSIGRNRAHVNGGPRNRGFSMNKHNIIGI